MQSFLSGLRSLAICSGQAKPVYVSQFLPVLQLPALPTNRHVSSPLAVQVSCMSVYQNSDANTLWKTMTGVSQQGKKRGRARNLLRPKNLNRGQMLGFGKKKIDFPGLSSKTSTGTGVSVKKKEITEMSTATYRKYEEGLEKSREITGQKRGKRKISPLERGWTGGKPLGRKFGPPKAVNEELSFDNFESVLLEFKTVFHMTGNLGRVRRTSALMVTGNGNGTFGFTLTAGKYGGNMKTFKSATNKAGLRLINIERYEDRTVFHDFFTQYANTRIYVEQRPPGTGVIAHRGIRAICELAGIKDLYAKLEGSNHIQSITKAFVLGLLRQKTHQTLADEKRLHLVEMRPENDYFPKVLASPSDGKVRTHSEIGHDEFLDFQMVSFEGHLPTPRPPKKNPWEGSSGWDLHLRRGWAYESHPRVRQRMRVENGEEWGAVRSHLYEKYPECVEPDRRLLFKDNSEASD